MKRIDEKIRAKAVAEVKEGSSYKQVSEKYGLSGAGIVRDWCIKEGVRSPYIHMKVTDEDVLNMLKDVKAATNSELAKLLEYGNPSTKLNRMVMEGKIQFIRIPIPSKAALVRRIFPMKYTGKRIYYLTEGDFVEWVRGHIPHPLSKGTRNSVSQMFRGTGVAIFAEKDKKKKKRKYTRKEYKTLEQQIMELWKSRGMDVDVIKFHCEDKKGIWTITARLKKLEK
ncbi:unnamed protein product [marine sediment metagenome]|uniref:Uncharacterized protein n=1 Tax=marine sediment metagenome TaxID=412755 RepID=X1I4D4_9ZZZZ